MTLVINYWSVLGATVAAMIIGSLWYSPVMFMKAWAKEIDHKPGNTSATKAMVGMLVVAFITAYVLAHFVNYAGAIDINGGLQLGFWVWLGFVATALSASSLFEGRSWKHFWIVSSHQLVTYLVMGAILTMWR